MFLRVLFLVPVLLFMGVSATFNILYSRTLSEGWIEQWCWVALGVGAALYSGLALDIARQNFRRRAPGKGVVALVFLLPALAWDARCAYGFASMEQDRARAEVTEQNRKYKSAENKLASARAALAAYETAPEPGDADATVDALAKRTNDARCVLRSLPDDAKSLCDQLSSARIAAARAHAKMRLTKVVEIAEDALNAAKRPPPKDALAELIGEQWAKWLPAAVLQLGTLLGTFAAAIPPAPKAPANPLPVPPAPTPQAPMQQPARVPARMPSPMAAPSRPAPPLAPHAGPTGLVVAIAGMIAEPHRCPPGVGIDAEGWLAGPQRPLATKLGMPVSRYNKELRAAAAAGALQVDTKNGVTRVRLAHVH